MHIFARAKTFFDQIGSAQQGGSHVPVVGRVTAADPLHLPGRFHQPFHPHRVAIVQHGGRAEKIDSLEIQTFGTAAFRAQALLDQSGGITRLQHGKQGIT